MICNNTVKVTKVSKDKDIINKTKKLLCYIVKSIKMATLLTASSYIITGGCSLGGGGLGGGSLGGGSDLTIFSGGDRRLKKN